MNSPNPQTIGLIFITCHADGGQTPKYANYHYLRFDYARSPLIKTTEVPINTNSLAVKEITT